MLRPKPRRAPIDSTINRGQYPKAPTIEELKELSKTKNARKLVLCHIGLTISIASKYATKIPSKDKDILGQALLILVECVDRYVRGETKHDYHTLPQYLHMSIDFGIKKFLKTDRLVRPPINSDWIIQLYKTNPDECFGQFNTYNYLDDPDEDNTTDRDVYKSFKKPKYLTSNTNMLNDILIREILDSDFFNTIERKILKMRWEGYTDEEIGNVIGVTKMCINKMKKRMRDRIDYLLTGKKMNIINI